MRCFEKAAQEARSQLPLLRVRCWRGQYCALARGRLVRHAQRSARKCVSRMKYSAKAAALKYAFESDGYARSNDDAEQKCACLCHSKYLACRASSHIIDDMPDDARRKAHTMMTAIWHFIAGITTRLRRFLIITLDDYGCRLKASIIFLYLRFSETRITPLFLSRI